MTGFNYWGDVSEAAWQEVGYIDETGIEFEAIHDPAIFLDEDGEPWPDWDKWSFLAAPGEIEE